MYHIIVNPASRSGKGLNIWKKVIEPALHQEQTAYQVYFSKEAGDVAKLAESITASGESVSLIILGGDGTVNEALQGIRDISKVILGYIPTGSSNDLARDLALPKNPLDALHRILYSGNPQSMDLGTVTFSDGSTHRFVVSCGIGFDAGVCEEALHSKMKSILNHIGLGKLTYLSIALKQLISAKTVSCRIQFDNGEPVQIPKIMFVASMLHRFEGGGFQFCPAAKWNDGILNLCTVGNIPKWLVLFALPTAFWGRHYAIKGVTPYEACHFTLQTSMPLWVHTDGEVKRKADFLEIACEKEVLSIIV